MRAVDAPARAFTSPTRACARRRDRARGRVAPKRSLKVTAVDVDARATIATMYDRINARDVAGALECVAEDVVYEDFNFPEPFVGKAAVRALFEESCSGIPDDLAFVVDEWTSGSGASVGCTWHVEIMGEAFPNARGCSLYRVNGDGKLTYARDVVESPAKLGEASFSIIRAVAPLVKKRIAAKKGVKLEEPAASGGGGGGEGNVAASVAFALGAAAYWYVLLLSPSDNPIPGDPAYAIKPETLQEVIASSTDFFYVLPLLNKFGIDLLGGAPYVNPVSLGLFNFAEAFIFMLYPLYCMDKRGRDLPALKLWSIGMFLTNAVLLPYMSIRAKTPVSANWAPDETASGWGETETQGGRKGLMSKVFGGTGLGVGFLSIYWLLLEDSTAGGLAERLAYFDELMKSSRLSIAFMVDIALAAAWQAYFMKSISQSSGKDCGSLAYIPYWGLCVWLLQDD
ncbi:unnamed product [Ostreococcus tauri]|uniref:Unnamed product n=1 Tax=Ostreococcus tauri TaxID=70448 RepID=A0A090M1N5_OSTTA|nr:unnamed product [Ostreococcus tauri]OUS47768.1 hypothetical protein BE221DRAFT_70623 [Ostreococcus tauri]CEF98145.1 unnamed product [Ostreococcus tauri]|eukprot:XP_003079566.2 unnamed product [Ostreococcus tauri]